MIRHSLHSGWEFCEAGTDAWLPAVVPGHVHVDLLRNGRIADPFVGTNEKDCQWVDERDWSYRTTVNWSPTQGLPRLGLRFEGLDTVCTVLLNGKRVAEHHNMFLPLEIDVTELLLIGANELRVDFKSAARVGRERRAAYLAKHGLPDDVSCFDERAFVRKAQCMFGWDWGPRLVSCGIWKPVTLVDAGPTNSPDPIGHLGSTSPIAKLVRERDAIGESFSFTRNGQPTFALGANWIPDHAFPSQATDEQISARVLQAKKMGCNMLRVWGGGIYESDAFYDACDELGIMVWQDFMFACSHYPDDPEWLEAIRIEAEYQVKRLRHHPCIALWCGGNECHQMWQDKWGDKSKQPDRFHGEAIYHEVLRKVVEEHDPQRAYVPNSPYGGERCNDGDAGDQHCWDVWHGRGDWTHYRESRARFCSEFGFASSPTHLTWAIAGVDPDTPLESEEVRWHNKAGKPFETFQSLVELHYPRSENLREWIFISQLNQRDALRAAIEHFRFSGTCRGALIWQLNDCWPVESWSVIEFGGQPKIAYFELRRLFAPLLLRIELDHDVATLSACLHNSDRPLSGTAVLGAFCKDIDEAVISASVEASIEPEGIETFLSITLDGSVYQVIGEFCGASVAFDLNP